MFFFLFCFGERDVYFIQYFVDIFFPYIKKEIELFNSDPPVVIFTTKWTRNTN